MITFQNTFMYFDMKLLSKPFTHSTKKRKWSFESWIFSFRRGSRKNCYFLIFFARRTNVNHPPPTLNPHKWTVKLLAVN